MKAVASAAEWDGERQFLVESVPYLTIEPFLRRVPWARLSPEAPKAYVSREALVRGFAARKVGGRPVQVAAIQPGREITAPAAVFDNPQTFTGNLTNSGTHLYLDQVATPITLEHVRFAYGYFGLRSYRCGGGSSTLRHAQLVRCYQPIHTEFTNAFYLQNSLIDGSTYYAIRGTSGRTINAEHLTAHRCGTCFCTGTTNVTPALLTALRKMTTRPEWPTTRLAGNN